MLDAEEEEKEKTSHTVLPLINHYSAEEEGFRGCSGRVLINVLVLHVEVELSNV